MEFLEALLPALVPLAFGVLGAFLGAVVVTSRALRRELAIDVEMLPSLPEPAAGLLKEEVTRRTFRLVAATRFPHLVVLDLFTLVGTLAVVAFLGRGFWEFTEGIVGPDILIIQATMGLALATTLWASFHFSWTDRAADRIAFIQEHLGKQAAEEGAKVNRIFVAPSMLLGAVCSFGVLSGAVIAAATEYAWPDWVPLLPLTALLLGAMWSSLWLHSKSRLGKVTDELLHAEARQAEAERLVAAELARQAKRDRKRRGRRDDQPNTPG